MSCEDHYEEALTELINAKRQGKAIAHKPRPRGENVVDLMDALKKSLETSEGTREKKHHPVDRKRGPHKRTGKPGGPNARRKPGEAGEDGPVCPPTTQHS